MGLSAIITVQQSLSTTPANQEYRRYDESTNNRTIYIGPEYSDLLNQIMSVKRSNPIRKANFRGVRKSELQFAESTSVVGAEGVAYEHPASAMLSLSFPAGGSETLRENLLDRIISSLQNPEIRDRFLGTGEV